MASIVNFRCCSKRTVVLLVCTALLTLQLSVTIGQENKLEPTGNVGIGTLNPSYKLEVAGNAHVSGVFTLGTGAFTGGYIGAGNTFLNYGLAAMKVADNSTINWSSTGSVDGTSDVGLARNTAGVLKVTNGSTGHGSIYAGGSGANYFGGYVGIGTATPNHHLEVSGNARVSGIFTTGIGIASSGYIGAGNVFLNYGPSTIKMADNSLMNWSSTSSVDGTSDVGLARNAPGVLKITNGSTGDGSIYAGGSSPNYFAGNVGIGTLAHNDYKLAVNGQALFTKVKVQLFGSWPDYVFEKDYKLPSLAEVEDFIRQNHHLPGIPTAHEIEKDGLDVGESQAVLLRKIEELTLYVIDLNKKLEAQQTLITQQEKRLGNQVKLRKK